jgi:MFS family permease
VVAAIVGALAPNPQVLFAARFLMGIGIGLDVPAALSMVAEHSSTSTKRTNVNQNMLYNYVALLTSYLMSWLLVVSGVGAELWRIQVAVGGLVALAIILIRFSIAEESAFWLASRGELHAAASVIEKAFRIHTVVETPAAEAAQARPRARYLDILRGAYLPRTILATQINLFQSIVYFAVGFYLPLTVGVLFRDPAVALLGTAGINVAGLIGGSCAAVFANRVGLRRQTIVGFGLEVPILVILGIGVVGGWMPPLGGVLFLFAFLLAHTFGPAQTGISIAALSYPTELRGQGTGFSYGIGRIGAVVGGVSFPLLLAGVGLGWTMIILALAPLLGALIAVAIKWDPTGEEADMELARDVVAQSSASSRAAESAI